MAEAVRRSECAIEVLAKPKLRQAHKFKAGLNFTAERTLEDDLPTTNDKISNPPAVCIAKGLVKVRSVLVIFSSAALICRASCQIIFGHKLLHSQTPPLKVE
jgi:hypothetical protein